MLLALKSINEKIVYYSEISTPISNIPRVDAKAIKNVVEIEFSDFKRCTEDIYLFQKHKQKFQLDINKFSCECSTYIDKAYCIHLLSLAEHLDIELDFMSKTKKFSVRKKRGRAPLAKKCLARD